MTDGRVVIARSLSARQLPRLRRSRRVLAECGRFGSDGSNSGRGQFAVETALLTRFGHGVSSARMERAPLAREDDWLRVVILEENRPQECGKRMRASAMMNYSLARRPRRDSNNNFISNNET